MKTQQKYLPLLMWFFPVLFFTYQFILRLWPGLMMSQIMEQFAIDASSFGLLAALYYYGYSGMQIPVAIMLDRFSARYIIFIFASLCGLAMLLFTYTNNWYLACLSRFLIGVGSSVGFLGTSKVISEWFPKNQYAKMVGFSFTVGLMGAIYGGKPISVLIENYSWEKVAVVLSVISIAIGLSTYFLLKNNNSYSLSNEREEKFKLVNLKKLLSSPIIWFLALANLCMVGSLEGFADVWGIQYMITAYNIEKSEAAELISFIFVGMLFGGPVLAFLSKKFDNYKVIALAGLIMGGAFFLLLFLIKSYNWYVLVMLFFLIGLMCCYQVIVFAAGANLVNSSLLGVTVAFLNSINMLGGSFFHTIIGYLMDIFWTGEFDSEGIKHYTLEVYQTALSIIPLCSVLGAIVIVIISLKARSRNEL